MYFKHPCLFLVWCHSPPVGTLEGCCLSVIIIGLWYKYQKGFWWTWQNYCPKGNLGNNMCADVLCNYDYLIFPPGCVYVSGTCWATWRWCSWTLRWRTSPASPSPGGSTGTSTTKDRAPQSTQRRWWRSWRWCSGTSRLSCHWPWWVPGGGVWLWEIGFMQIY